MTQGSDAWVERALTTIIADTAAAAAEGVGPHTLCRYLIDAMDWFASVRPEPETPEPFSFEAWLLARSLARIRSEVFEASVECEYLRAEWERGR